MSKKIKKQKKALTLRLDVDVHEELRVFAEQKGLGLSTFIRTVIVDFARNRPNDRI